MKDAQQLHDQLERYTTKLNQHYQELPMLSGTDHELCIDKIHSLKRNIAYLEEHLHNLG